MMERLSLEHSGILDFDPNFLPGQEADQLMAFLSSNVSWEQKFYKYGGKQVAQPRLTAWYADTPKLAYSYSGLTQVVQPWIPELSDLKKKVEAATGVPYNSVLLNFYRDGKDSVGLHADDERELGRNPNIASVSLGATRDFILVRNGAPEITLNYQLSHGSLLVMSGTTQTHWKHQVPKDYSLKEGRINLTFRTIHV